MVDRLSAVLGLKREQAAEPLISWEQLPDGLADFARSAALPPDDVAMLARLQYRGQQPKTRQQWQMLYYVIKAAIES